MHVSGAVDVGGRVRVERRKHSARCSSHSFLSDTASQIVEASCSSFAFALLSVREYTRRSRVASLALLLTRLLSLAAPAGAQGCSTTAQEGCHRHRGSHSRSFISLFPSPCPRLTLASRVARLAGDQDWCSSQQAASERFERGSGLGQGDCAKVEG